MKKRNHCSLAIAVATALFTAMPAASALEYLRPGESAIIEAGEAPEDWVLSSATLTMRPGAYASAIRADGSSSIFIDGGTIAGSIGRALDLRGSTALVKNGVFDAVSGISLQGGTSIANISDSSITSKTQGIIVFLGGTANLSSSMVSSDQTGIMVEGEGTVNVDRNSQILGGRIALHILDGWNSQPGPEKRVTVDDSILKAVPDRPF